VSGSIAEVVVIDPHHSRSQCIERSSCSIVEKRGDSWGARDHRGHSLLTTCNRHKAKLAQVFRRRMATWTSLDWTRSHRPPPVE
jgi:hypothetical protein